MSENFKGYIKLTVVPHDDGPEIQAEIHMSGVGIIEKISLLSTFARTLDMDEGDLMAAAAIVPMFREAYDGKTIQINTGAIREAAGEGEAED